MSATLPTGSTFASYVIDEVIARGGMGVVYRATQTQPRRRIALKLIAPEHAGNAAYRERFLREADLLASMEHPNIVPIYAAGEFEGQLFLAMRYIDGPDLGTILARNGPLTLQRTIELLTPVAAALDAAHDAGLVHRDVKPANILLDGRGSVYLTDFGLTKKTRSNSGLTAAGQAIGTPGYMAPEQLTASPTDPALASRIDVYALGCVLHACLTGEEPYVRDSYEQALFAHVYAPPPEITARRPELPRELDSILARALAKTPADRFESAGAFVAAVREAARASIAPGGSPAAAAAAAGAAAAGAAGTGPNPPSEEPADATQVIPARPVDRSAEPVPPPPAERRPVPDVAPLRPPTPSPGAGAGPAERGDLPTVVAPHAAPSPISPPQDYAGYRQPAGSHVPAQPVHGQGGAPPPGAGHGAYAGGAPRPDRPSLIVPAAIGGGVAVLGLAAIMWFGGFVQLPGGTAAASPTPTATPTATPTPRPTPTATPEPTPTPTPEDGRYGDPEDVEALLALVPAEIVDSCAESPIYGETGIATVLCDADGLGGVWYELYPDLDSLQDRYEDVRESAGVARDSGDCEAGEESDDGWVFNSTSDITRGRYLCSHFEGRAWMDYTVDYVNVLVTLRGVDDDIAALWQTWSSGDTIPPLP